MMHLMRTVLHKIAAQREKRQCEAQRRAIDAKIAELEALMMRLPRSYIHPAKWRDARC